MTGAAPLDGWRVLVPRGSDWGRDVAARVEAAGARALIAPLIRTDPVDTPQLGAALADLAAGRVGWVVATSAAVAPVIARATTPAGVRVAAVGPATATALAEHGIRSDFAPTADYSARGILAEWPSVAPERVLLLHSDLAAPLLADGLRAKGHTVDSVVAYRTVAVPLDDDARAWLRADGPRAVLVTSGSVAQALAASGPIPPEAVIVCLGPSTAVAARDAGLAVHAVAAQQTVDALISALADHADQARRGPSAPIPQEETA